MESVYQKLTLLADEVRDLSGTTDLVGIDSMTTNINDANAEVNTQTDLIDQITTALEDKAGSGSSSGETNDRICTVTFNNQSISGDCSVKVIVATVLENGVRETYIYYYDVNGIENLRYLFTVPNVVCGTKIYLISTMYNVTFTGVFTEIDGSAVYESNVQINSYDDTLLTFTAPSVENENCTIYYAANP